MPQSRLPLVIVNSPSDWPLHVEGVEIVTARAYVTDPAYAARKNVQVFNMCRSYRYQTLGYYVSLLAVARGHHPIPDVMTIQDLKSATLTRLVSEDFDQEIQKALKPVEVGAYHFELYFGHSVDRRLDRLAAQIFNLFPAPFLRAKFSKNSDGWNLIKLEPLAANDILQEHKGFAVKSAEKYFASPRKVRKKKSARYDLAILYDPFEKHRPSSDAAIKKFEKAAESLGFYVERITREDYSRLAEFDALFIRQTTSVNHFTYRFARRAEALGMVVMDDPQSILRCTNKVYLAELMLKNKVPVPWTVILHKGNFEEAARDLGFPMVLKQPDSAFSQGVVKVKDAAELKSVCENLLMKSELLIAQEFLPTEFDWRIGIIDGQPLYVCKYHMVKKHWQIARHDSGHTRYGQVETIPVEQAPTRLIKTALKGANLIGKGLYGVDLKQVGNQFYLIEVNDNPNIDTGCEDAILKDELYRRIMRVFLRQVEDVSSGNWA